MVQGYMIRMEKSYEQKLGDCKDMSENIRIFVAVMKKKMFSLLI